MINIAYNEINKFVSVLTKFYWNFLFLATLLESKDQSGSTGVIVETAKEVFETSSSSPDTSVTLFTVITVGYFIVALLWLYDPAKAAKAALIIAPNFPLDPFWWP